MFPEWLAVTPLRFSSSLLRPDRSTKFRNDLDAFEALAVGNPDLMRLIRSPVFGADEQAKALGAVLARAGIAGLAAQFLKVVAANRRLFAVREIIRDFRALVASHKGEVTADVTVAEQLNDARFGRNQKHAWQR